MGKKYFSGFMYNGRATMGSQEQSMAVGDYADADHSHDAYEDRAARLEARQEEIVRRADNVDTRLRTLEEGYNHLKSTMNVLTDRVTSIQNEHAAINDRLQQLENRT